MNKASRKKEFAAQGISETPGPVGVAGGISPGSPRRLSKDCRRNNERMVCFGETFRAVKATGDQMQGEKEAIRREVAGLDSEMDTDSQAE